MASKDKGMNMVKYTDKPECIYIATRLTAPHPIGYLHNLQESIDVGIEVWKKGHYPYIPGLDFILIMHIKDIKVEQIYKSSLDWMSRGDSILVHNGYHDEPKSPGVIKEVEVAKESGLKFYWNIDEIPVVRKND